MAPEGEVSFAVVYRNHRRLAPWARAGLSTSGRESSSSFCLFGQSGHVTMRRTRCLQVSIRCREIRAIGLVTWANKGSSTDNQALPVLLNIT